MDEIVREPERQRITGLSRTTWWRHEKQGRAPRRVALSDNAVGWLRSELDEWLQSRRRVDGEVEAA